MACIIVGIATIDIVNTIASFPQEDSKVRRCPRFPLATCLEPHSLLSEITVVCAQLGAWESLKWMGSLVDPHVNADAQFVCDDLAAYGIDSSLCEIHPHGSLPTSYIMSSQDTGSRTIFHHRDLPEVSVQHFINHFTRAKNVSWVHLECREALNQSAMIRHVRESNSTAFISLEVEASRHAWNQVKSVLPLVSCVFFAKSYVVGLEFASAEEFFQHILSIAEITSSLLRYVIIPWGASGAYYLSLDTQTIQHVDTIPIEHPVDTVGAGDTFVAATISALYKSKPIHDAVVFGCQVAHAKCRMHGFCFNDDQRQEFQNALMN